MTAPAQDMAALRKMAALSDLAPRDPAPGLLARWRALLWWKRQPKTGLEAIPERYRLQFLGLASERLPGASPDDVRALADRIADTVTLPRHLVKALPDPRPLDAWFKAAAPRIKAWADAAAMQARNDGMAASRAGDAG